MERGKQPAQGRCRHLGKVPTQPPFHLHSPHFSFSLSADTSRNPCLTPDQGTLVLPWIEKQGPDHSARTPVPGLWGPAHLLCLARQSKALSLTAAVALTALGRRKVGQGGTCCCRQSRLPGAQAMSEAGDHLRALPLQRGGLQRKRSRVSSASPDPPRASTGQSLVP